MGADIWLIDNLKVSARAATYVKSISILEDKLKAETDHAKEEDLNKAIAHLYTSAVKELKVAEFRDNYNHTSILWYLGKTWVDAFKPFMDNGKRLITVKEFSDVIMDGVDMSELVPSDKDIKKYISENAGILFSKEKAQDKEFVSILTKQLQQAAANLKDFLEALDDLPDDRFRIWLDI